MPKYTADKFELRVAALEANLAASTPLLYWDSIKYSVKHGRKKTPVGINSRLQEVYPTLLDYSGSCSGWYDETAVGGSADLLTAFGAFEQGDLTPLYLSITNKITGAVITLKKVVGDPTHTISSPDGFSMWSVDFDFEDIEKS